MVHESASWEFFIPPPIRCGTAENMENAAVKQAETHAALIHQNQGYLSVSDGEARWMRGRGGATPGSRFPENS